MLRSSSTTSTVVASPSRHASAPRRRTRRARLDRQRDRGARRRPSLRLDRDGAAVGLDDAAGDRQAEAGARAVVSPRDVRAGTTARRGRRGCPARRRHPDRRPCRRRRRDVATTPTGPSPWRTALLEQVHEAPARGGRGRPRPARPRDRRRSRRARRAAGHARDDGLRATSSRSHQSVCRRSPPVSIADESSRSPTSRPIRADSPLDEVEEAVLGDCVVPGARRSGAGVDA